MESGRCRAIGIETFARILPNPLFGDLLAEQVAKELSQADDARGRVGAVALEPVVLEQQIAHVAERDPLRAFDESTAQRLLNATTQERQCFLFVCRTGCFLSGLSIDVELDEPVLCALLLVERTL